MKITKETAKKIIKKFQEEWTLGDVIEKTYNESVEGFKNHFCLNLATEDFEVCTLSEGTLNVDFLISLYVIKPKDFQDISENEDELEYLQFWASENEIEIDIEKEIASYVE